MFAELGHLRPPSSTSGVRCGIARVREVTVLELLVVVSITGLIAGLSLPQVAAQLRKSRLNTMTRRIANDIRPLDALERANSVQLRTDRASRSASRSDRPTVISSRDVACGDGQRWPTEERAHREHAH